jgi:hypothetical protein
MHGKIQIQITTMKSGKLTSCVIENSPLQHELCKSHFTIGSKHSFYFDNTTETTRTHHLTIVTNLSASGATTVDNTSVTNHTAQHVPG